MMTEYVPLGFPVIAGLGCCLRKLAVICVVGGGPAWGATAWTMTVSSLAVPGSITSEVPTPISGLDPFSVMVALPKAALAVALIAGAATAVLDVVENAARLVRSTMANMRCRTCRPSL